MNMILILMGRTLWRLKQMSPQDIRLRMNMGMTSLMMTMMKNSTHMLPVVKIMDDDKPSNGNDQPKRLKKNDQLNKSERQIVVKNATGVPELESEDEDGFPISTSHKSKVASRETQVVADEEDGEKTSEDSAKKKASSDQDTNKKRKVKSMGQDEQQERKKNKKKKKEKGEKGQVYKAITDDETNVVLDGENNPDLRSQNLNQI